MMADVWSRFRAVARQWPDHPAVLKGDAGLTFAELGARAAQFSLQLRNRGLPYGGRCIVWAKNSPEMAIAILGVLAARMIPTIVNAQSPTAHISHAAERTKACALITDQDHASRLTFDGVVFDLEQLGLGGPDAVSGTDALPVLFHDPASVLFTSGSTGLPKGAAQSHANLIWGADAVGRALGLSHNDRLLGTVPWAFDYGWGQLLSTFLLGVTQVLPDVPGPIGLCAAIERHKPTVLPGVPSLYAELIRGISPIRDTDLASLRLITNTGSKISKSLFADTLDLFPDVEISLNYGLTETYRSATLSPDLARSKPGSVGRALPGAGIAVITEDGGIAKPGELGEIVHRGAGVFLGYWGDPIKTAQVRRPDPLHCETDLPAAPAVYTGDIGWIDDEGHLFVQGRRDRQIKSMGVRVSPDEVEGLIEATGLVDEVAIIGVPHEIVGQQVVAVVVIRGDPKLSLRELKKLARQSMSPFMQPMVWHVVDALPRTSNGKIDYPTITATYAGPSGETMVQA
ncbi:class I adenylate-forming enzyme family protein [Arenibacterium sp. CAU 1754]